MMQQKSLVWDRTEKVVMTARETVLWSLPGHLLRCAQQVHTEIWGRLVPSVTGAQYAVLAAVASWEDVDQARLGELASIDKSTAGDIVARLVAADLLLRNRDPADRRRNVLHLTSTARERLAGITRSAAAVQEYLLDRVPDPGRHAFITALAALARVDDTVLDTQPADSRVLHLATTPGHLLRRAQQLHTAAWTDVIDEVTGPQYAVLVATRHSGSASHAEIGALASVDSSSTQDIVRRLLARGWLERVDGHDRRARPVRVVPARVADLDRLGPLVDEVQHRLVAPLTAAGRNHLADGLRSIALPVHLPA